MSVKGKFTIDSEEEDEETIEISFDQENDSKKENSDHPLSYYQTEGWSLGFIWSIITYQWVKPLLVYGNMNPLEQNDLYALRRFFMTD